MRHMHIETLFIIGPHYSHVMMSDPTDDLPDDPEDRLTELLARCVDRPLLEQSELEQAYDVWVNEVRDQ